MSVWIDIVHDATVKAGVRLCASAWRRPDFTCFQAGGETAIRAWPLGPFGRYAGTARGRAVRATARSPDCADEVEEIGMRRSHEAAQARSKRRGSGWGTLYAMTTEAPTGTARNKSDARPLFVRRARAVTMLLNIFLILVCYYIIRA